MRHLILILLVFVSQIAMGASFDCSKAHAPIEHAICENPELSEADSILSQRYQELRKQLSKSEAKILKYEQREWLKQRLEQCAVYAIPCLVGMYRARIIDFEERLGQNSLSIQSSSSGYNDFVLSGYKVLDVTEGDLNRDEYTDVVLILAHENEEEIGDSPRPLFILTRDADDMLHLTARNDDVVLCVQCGGMFGDPYQKTVIKNGYFTVEHYGGSSWRWTKYITFKYSSKQSDWYLHKITDESYHSAEPDNKETSTKTRENFGTVLFTDYRNEW